MRRVDCERALPSVEAARERLEALRDAQHRHCFVCGPHQDPGLRLTFRPVLDGGVEADFDCDGSYQGYARQLHGGVICALLDAAMTHCLFAQGEVGVTAELTVRFLRPARVGCRATVRARSRSRHARLHRMQAELLQDGAVMATATATFMRPVALPRSSATRGE